MGEVDQLQDMGGLFFVFVFVFLLLIDGFGFAYAADLPGTVDGGRDIVDEAVYVPVEAAEGESENDADGEASNSAGTDLAAPEDSELNLADTGDIVSNRDIYDFLVSGIAPGASDDDIGEDIEAGEEPPGFEYESFRDLLVDALVSAAEMLEPVEELPEEPPPIHEHMSPLGISPASIGTQTAMPYTGGGFMALSTNYGTGLLIFPEQYKSNTFGFVKNTNRVVNLTNSTITCYWIMGGTTYNARVQRFLEPEYAYVSGSTTTYRTLTISALTDSNVQFLDETGERGIQRPHFSLEARVMITFLIIEIAIHVMTLIFRR